MASTTAKLIERIRDILTDTGSRETFNDAEIIRTAINPVAREIASLALVAADATTVSTVAGTRAYALPAAIVPFVEISTVTIGDSRKPLEWMDRQQMASETASGEPVAWTIYANQIQFHPIPDAVYTVYIDAYNAADAAVEADPATSSDELVFTADVEDCLVWGCAEILSAINREPEREKAFGDRYQRKITQLRQKLQPDNYLPASIGNVDESDNYFGFI